MSLLQMLESGIFSSVSLFQLGLMADHSTI